MKWFFKTTTVITFYAIPGALGAAIYVSMENKVWAAFLCLLVGYVFSAFCSSQFDKKDGGAK